MRRKFRCQPDEVLLCYFFLDRWNLPPNVTLQQDEAMMNDLMEMDREVNYKHWARAHGVVEPDEETDEVFVTRPAPSYQSLFGAN